MRQPGVGQIDVPGRPIAVVVDRLAKLLVHSLEKLRVVFQSTAANAVTVVALGRVADGTTTVSVLFLFATVVPLPLSQFTEPGASHLKALQDTEQKTVGNVVGSGLQAG